MQIPIPQHVLMRRWLLSVLMMVASTAGLVWAEPEPKEPDKPPPDMPTNKPADKPAVGPSLEELSELDGPVSRVKLRERARRRRTLLEARDLRDGLLSDPLDQLMRGLDDVTILLRCDLNTGRDAQSRGEEAVKLLDKLIEEAISRAPPSDSEGSASSTDPMGRSRPSLGGAGEPNNQGPPASGGRVGDPAAPGGRSHGAPPKPTGPLMKAWGQLPPRIRDQIVTGVGEASHPDYQRLVDSFYTRLGRSAVEASRPITPGPVTPVTEGPR